MGSTIDTASPITSLLQSQQASSYAEFHKTTVLPPLGGLDFVSVEKLAVGALPMQSPLGSIHRMALYREVLTGLVFGAEAETAAETLLSPFCGVPVWIAVTGPKVSDTEPRRAGLCQRQVCTSAQSDTTTELVLPYGPKVRLRWYQAPQDGRIFFVEQGRAQSQDFVYSPYRDASPAEEFMGEQ